MKHNTHKQAIKQSAIDGQVMRDKASQASGVTLSLSVVRDIDMTSRDKAKVGSIIQRAVNTLGRAWHGTTESSQTLMNMVEKVQSLKPEALDGGAELQAEIIGVLWTLYAQSEAIGEDDAHYLVSDLPCNEYQHGLMFYKPRKRWNGEQSHGLPVSPYLRLSEIHKAGISEGIEPSELKGYALDVIQPSQPKRAWSRPTTGKSDTRIADDLIKAAGAFTRMDSAYTDEAPIEYPEATQCREHSEPASTAKPWDDLTWISEPITGGQSPDWDGEWTYVYADDENSEYSYRV